VYWSRTMDPFLCIDTAVPAISYESHHLIISGIEATFLRISIHA